MRANYHTQQKTALLDFLKQNASKQFTIDEITEALSDHALGKSTVYRLMKKLCDEGIVRRFSAEGSRAAAYQLSGKGCCAEHLHLKCVDCGLLIHLDDEATASLTKATGFVIDDGKSMLYGKCASCARRGK